MYSVCSVYSANSKNYNLTNMIKISYTDELNWCKMRKKNKI